MTQAAENSKRNAFLAERKTGIGGSDVAAVIGISRWKTPLEVWEEKTGRANPTEESPAMYWGTMLEAVVADEFAKRTGFKVERCEMLRDEWRIANLDRVVIEPNGTKVLLECKTANAYADLAWGESQELEIVNKQAMPTAIIPDYYTTQVQWYLGVTGFPYAYVAVLIGGQDFRIYRIESDNELIDLLVERCRQFWFGNVIRDIPPEPITAADSEKLYAGKQVEEIPEADSETALMISNLINIKLQTRDLDKQASALKEKIIAALKDKTGFAIGGKKACSFVISKYDAFDTKRFAAEHPDLYQEYKTPTTRSVFRTY